MSSLLDNAGSRLRDPSTHAGIALILQALAHFFPAWATVLNAIAALFAGTTLAAPGNRREINIGQVNRLGP